MGKIELRQAELLDALGAFEALKSSRQHATVRVSPQEQWPPELVAALKKFHHDFFDRPNDGTEARSVAQITLEALAGEARDLQLLLDQKNAYSFLGDLEPIAKRIKGLSEKDYPYLLNHLDEFAQELLTAKQQTIAPLKAFMHGKQREVYDQIITFLAEEKPNLGEVAAEELQPVKVVMESSAPYQGDVLPKAKAAMANIRRLIDAALTEECDGALKAVDEAVRKIEALPDFGGLEERHRAQVMEKSDQARKAIDAEKYISGIRDRLRRYLTVDYPAQLALVNTLAHPAGDEEPKPEVRYIPVGTLRPEYDLAFISTEDELQQWLEALRRTIAAELAKGNRITL
jgi:hypothetical protein